MTTQSSPSLDAEAWERRYQEGTTGWDLGQPAPAFVTLLASPQAPPPGSAIVLGAGRGYDALLFARHGFTVTAVDFAPSALVALNQMAAASGVTINLVQRDIFQLLPEFQGQFDYVIEHTCFCALDLALRDTYVQLVSGLLAPKGELLAVFFTHNRSGGPPFGSSPTELRQRFSPQFELTTLEPVANSVPARQGEEYLGRFQRPGLGYILKE
ncbi:methyltransferase domain-containing protein [Nodosilinea sp. P-1105]|uniref:methyltransferase domain-containing protein n=1 Tax=Nodosilinea sp. P-1105 TaxID=2546229 RepID=UPI00146D8BBE|nr:methyltransferase domain-containing protein [Nodosilinea sp. P-1105]NMF84962.1 methyltransferase domain-containing protein [Nodosilinea sp. P-1105]